MERISANVLAVCTALLLACSSCGTAAAADRQGYVGEGYVETGANYPTGYATPAYGYPGITYGGPAVSYWQYERLGVWPGYLTGCNACCTGLWNNYCNEPHCFCCRVKTRCRPLGYGAGPACPAGCGSAAQCAPRWRLFGGFWARCRALSGAPAACGCADGSTMSEGAVNGSSEELSAPPAPPVSAPSLEQPLPPGPAPDDAT